MKFFKTNKKKIIAAILTIATLSALFAIAGNAYQMGGPKYYTESGVNKYRIYLWNEDTSNMTNSTPYTLHADMEYMSSTYTFAIVYATVVRYNSESGLYDVDDETSFIQYNLNNNFYNLDNKIARQGQNGVYATYSVSNICSSSSTSVTDAVIKNYGRSEPVQANAHVIVGKLINYYNSPNCKAYYKWKTYSGWDSYYFKVQGQQDIPYLWN